LIVIHTTEGSAHGQSAEDGAAYDARRTDGTSTHYFHDDNSTVQCVRTEDRAHTARAQGNRRGIQHELCGRAGWSAGTWADTYAQSMLQRAAKQAARDVKKWGIPVRHLTVAQVRDGVKGFCGHWDITRAFPADGGTHTDPGPNFPWSQFLDMVRAELAGRPINDKEDDMADANVISFSTAAKAVVQAETTEGVLGYNAGGMVASGEPAFIAAAAGQPPASVLRYFRQLCNQVAELQARPPATVDVDALAAALLAGGVTLTKEDVTSAVLDALRMGTDQS
jgi:hypothetical protein